MCFAAAALTPAAAFSAAGGVAGGMAAVEAASAAASAASMMSTIGTVAQVGGTLMSAYGAYSNASAQQQAAQQQAAIAAQNAENARVMTEYNAAVTRNNADYARMQAEDYVRQGEAAQADQRRKAAALKGTQVASMAARGLDVTDGSAASILSDTDLFAEIDSLTIKDNAAKMSWAKKMDAWNYDAQAKGIQMSGNADYDNKMAQSRLYSAQASGISPLMAGVSSLVSGGASVAEKWYSYNKQTKNSGAWYNDSV